ncbi:MAG: glucosaminidase domain-containing protein [Woeseia sp.]
MDKDGVQLKTRYALISALAVFVVGGLLLLRVELPHVGEQSLPDLPVDDIAARKAAFFAFLKPIVRHHNSRIRNDRAWLLALDDTESLSFFERRRYAALAERHGVDLEVLSAAEARQLLQRRVDVIPEALVLVQAAKESGWGRSRFARNGNALFGEWCFSRGCGMVPSNRASGRSHEVRRFESVHDAVASYMDNLNSHSSYLELRIAREAMRANGEKLSALRLAEHLTEYSERREEYVREVKAMILQNDLESAQPDTATDR